MQGAGVGCVRLLLFLLLLRCDNDISWQSSRQTAGSSHPGCRVDSCWTQRAEGLPAHCAGPASCALARKDRRKLTGSAACWLLACRFLPAPACRLLAACLAGCRPLPLAPPAAFLAARLLPGWASAAPCAAAALEAWAALQPELAGALAAGAAGTVAAAADERRGRCSKRGRRGGRESVSRRCTWRLQGHTRAGQWGCPTDGYPKASLSCRPASQATMPAHVQNHSRTAWAVRDTTRLRARLGQLGLALALAARRGAHSGGLAGLYRCILAALLLLLLLGALRQLGSSGIHGRRRALLPRRLLELLWRLLGSLASAVLGRCRCIRCCVARLLLPLCFIIQRPAEMEVAGPAGQAKR